MKEVQASTTNTEVGQKQKETGIANSLKIGGQDYDFQDEVRVLRLIHEMSHTKVETEVSDRYVEITPERLDVIISAVTRSNWGYY